MVLREIGATSTNIQINNSLFFGTWMTNYLFNCGAKAGGICWLIYLLPFEISLECSMRFRFRFLQMVPFKFSQKFDKVFMLRFLVLVTYVNDGWRGRQKPPNQDHFSVYMSSFMQKKETKVYWIDSKLPKIMFILCTYCIYWNSKKKKKKSWQHL